MKKYQSHKIVEAAKITAIDKTPVGNFLLTLEGEEEQVTVFADEAARKPVFDVGWYYVKYSDGYTSFSPAEQFEEGYSEAKQAAEKNDKNPQVTPPKVDTTKPTGAQTEQKQEAKQAPRSTIPGTTQK